MQDLLGMASSGSNINSERLVCEALAGPGMRVMFRSLPETGT
jgi:hypothetical protein